HVADIETLPDRRIELPGPALAAFRVCSRLQRMARDVIDDIAVLARLRRRETEASHRGVERRIDAVRPESAVGRPARPVRRIDRAVDDDRAGQPLAIERAGENGDEAAEGVTDN